MKIVVGLGNPGSRYRQTRHNVGFRVVGELAGRCGVSQGKLRFDAEIVDVNLGGEKVLLAAPQTYMNESGRCVRQMIDFYKLPLDELIVVSDDLNLDPGRLRMRSTGTAGGQKGLQDIIRHLGTEQFARLRIGIGRPPGQMDAADYVLGKFARAETELMESAIMRAADGIELWISSGLDSAMNQVNAPQEA